MGTARVYNAGFGDCSILMQEDYNFLIDCGGEDKFAATILPDVNSWFGARDNNYALISHLHDDHCRNLHKLNKRSLRRLILPNFIEKHDIDVLFISILISPNRRPYNRAYWVLSLIPKLFASGIFAPGAIISFVSDGSQLSFSESSFSDCVIHNPVSNPNKDVINAIIEKLDSSSDDALHAFLRTMRSVEGLYADLSQGASFPLVDSADFSRVSYAYRDALEHFADVPISLPEDVEGLSGERIAQIDENVRIIAELQKMLDSMRLDDLPDISSVLSPSEKRAISQRQNELSIVFEMKFSQDRVLFLGDVTKRRFNQIANRFSGKRFETIKVSHHGTTSYFTPNLPKSKYLVISNSAGRQSWDIDPRYPVYYMCRQLICTGSNKCAFYNNVGTECEKVFQQYKNGPCVCGVKNYHDVPIV